MQTNPQELILASSAGHYNEQPVAAPLAKHFRCTWSHRLPQDFGKRVAVVPDGCSDIIWSEHGLFVAGPDRTAAFPRLEAGATVVGIRFQPAAAAGWLNLSMAEITGATVSLPDLWGVSGTELQQRMHDMPSAAEKLPLLQTVLQQRMPDVPTPCPDMRRTFETLAHQRDNDEDTVGSLIRKLGFGERTFRRRCLEHFCYGPKTLDRILRFQRLLRLMKQARPTPMALLALEAGYADQAHMSRETKGLASLSPAEIRRQLAK